MKLKRGDYFKWNTVGRKSLQVEHCGPEIPEFLREKFPNCTPETIKVRPSQR
jgi:hypothetical protein